MRLSFDALNLSRRLGGDDPQGRHRATVVDELIQQASVDVRSALTQLRPPGLEEQGLFSALENELADRARELQPLEVALLSDLNSQRWPHDVEYSAFMIAREALANARQHARADHVTISVDGDARSLLLRVDDDGIGIPDAARPSRPGHLGLVGMRERALAVGAQLTIDTPPSGGTTVCFRWEEPA